MWYVVCVMIGMLVGFMLRGVIEAARQTSSSEIEIPLSPPDKIDETIETVITRAYDKIIENKLIIEGATDEEKEQMFADMLDRKQQRDASGGTD